MHHKAIGCVYLPVCLAYTTCDNHNANHIVMAMATEDLLQPSFTSVLSVSTSNRHIYSIATKQHPYWQLLRQKCVKDIFTCV